MEISAALWSAVPDIQYCYKPAFWQTPSVPMYSARSPYLTVEVMMNRIQTSCILIAVTAIALVLPTQAQKQLQKQPNAFRTWPAGTSPGEIGKRVADRLLTTPHFNYGNPGLPSQITYPEVATWYGALTFAQVSRDKDLQSRLIRRFEPLFGDEAKLIPNPVHVDNTVFAAVPLQIYMQTKEQKYLGLGRTFADKQWENPT